MLRRQTVENFKNVSMLSRLEESFLAEGCVRSRGGGQLPRKGRVFKQKGLPEKFLESLRMAALYKCISNEDKEPKLSNFLNLTL